MKGGVAWHLHAAVGLRLAAATIPVVLHILEVTASDACLPADEVRQWAHDVAADHDTHGSPADEPCRGVGVQCLGGSHLLKDRGRGRSLPRAKRHGRKGRSALNRRGAAG